MLYKWLPGYEEKYSITKNGKIYSHKNRWGNITPVLRKQVLGNVGYYVVSLWKDNKETQNYVHRLLALTYIPNPDNKKFINHKNGIKTDNNLSNLEWCTQKENNQHAHQIGLNYSHFKTKPRAGELATFSKLKASDIPLIRASLLPVKDLAKKYGVTTVNIRYIKRRLIWKHIL